MNKKDIVIKLLSVVGTILVWLPILAPVFFSLVAFVVSRRFLFDYLMPAELFPLVLAGGILLIISAILTRSHLKLTIFSFITACASLVIGQALAVVTGLASGRIEPTGWQWLLVILSLVIYSAAVIAMGIAGLIMLGLFKKHRPT